MSVEKTLLAAGLEVTVHWETQSMAMREACMYRRDPL